MPSHDNNNKEGKREREKNKYDTNTSLGNHLTILFCHRKALLCKTFDISQNFFGAGG